LTTVVRSVVGRDLWSWFEALAIGLLIATGLGFTIVGWSTFEGTGRTWVLLALLVGLLSAIAVIPLRNGGHHVAAAAAALISIVTPTGFAYVANLLMIFVAIIELARTRSAQG
jgi:hypothetical protein